MTTCILNAKLQFLRTLEVCCKQQRVIWNIAGSFVKNILGDSDYNDTMDVFLISPINSNNNVTKSVLNDLEILQVIKKIKYNAECTHAKCVIDICLTEKLFTFKVMFHIDCPPSFSTSTDQLILSNNGLSVSSFFSSYDAINQTGGIAMLQRLIEIRKKEITLFGNYYNIPSNLTIRIKNAHLMKSQKYYMQSGYTIKGQNILAMSKVSDECPVCYEPNKISTNLLCGHTFCVSCIASHIEQDNTSSSHCPLCRDPIRLSFTNCD